MNSSVADSPLAHQRPPRNGDWVAGPAMSGVVQCMSTLGMPCFRGVARPSYSSPIWHQLEQGHRHDGVCSTFPHSFARLPSLSRSLENSACISQVRSDKESDHGIRETLTISTHCRRVAGTGFTCYPLPIINQSRSPISFPRP